MDFKRRCIEQEVGRFFLQVFERHHITSGRGVTYTCFNGRCCIVRYLFGVIPVSCEICR